MRITDRYQSLMDRVGAGAARSVDRTGRAEGVSRAKAPESALEVTVSDRAQKLASGSARIEELRTAIENGSFVVDSARIARRLVGLLGDDEG